MDGNIAGYRFNKDLPVVVDFGGDILSIHGDDQGGAFPGLHLCMVASTKKNGLLCHNALFRNNMANFSISAQHNRKNLIGNLVHAQGVGVGALIAHVLVESFCFF